MKILVCLKQVPAPENNFTLSSFPPGYQEAGITFKTNSYDEYAMEEALCIQDAFPDTEIAAVSLGPQRARSTLLRAMELGAKEGIHLLDPSSPKRDPQAIAFMIAHWARQVKFDLILSNPPYIAEIDYRILPPEVLADPKIALTSGLDGLDHIRLITRQAPDYLKEKGRLMFEIAFDQAALISEMTEGDIRYRSLSIVKDLNDIDRVVILSV